MMSSPPSYPKAEACSDRLLPVHKIPHVEGRERWSNTFEIDNGNPIWLDVSQPESQWEGQEHLDNNNGDDDEDDVEDDDQDGRTFVKWDKASKCNIC